MSPADYIKIHFRDRDENLRNWLNLLPTEQLRRVFVVVKGLLDGRGEQ